MPVRGAVFLIDRFHPPASAHAASKTSKRYMRTKFDIQKAISSVVVHREIEPPSGRL